MTDITKETVVNNTHTDNADEMGKQAYARSQKKKIRITLDDPSLRFSQRLVATTAIIVPFVGLVTASILAAKFGVTTLDIVLLISMFFLTNLGVELGYHRLFSHKAFKTSSLVRYTLMVFGQMAGQGGVIYWVATHRRHHIYSDTPADPHSPHIRHTQETPESMGFFRGLLHGYLGWMLNDKVTNNSAFAKDLLKDPLTKKINSAYVPIVSLGLIVPGIIGGIVTQTWFGVFTGFLWGGLVRMFFVTHSLWLGGTCAHIFGGRPYKTGDHSANNLWFAIPTLGASLQNNHHAFPSSAILGFKWWQIDIGWYVIWALEKCGIVWQVSRPKNIKTKLKKNPNNTL